MVCFTSPSPWFRTARYGHEYEFVDNANVIFEAGMLQANTNAPAQIPTGWIPIREKNSPHPPFDFAAQRTILIKRSKGGGLTDNILRVNSKSESTVG
jgi:hypothetical protein